MEGKTCPKALHVIWVVWKSLYLLGYSFLLNTCNIFCCSSDLFSPLMEAILKYILSGLQLHFSILPEFWDGVHLVLIIWKCLFPWDLLLLLLQYFVYTYTLIYLYTLIHVLQHVCKHLLALLLSARSMSCSVKNWRKLSV